jgi:plasmid maintenance system antidote protein VapI
VTGLRGQLTALLAGELAASGWSQADLARAVGITPKHMSQIVTGRANAGPDLADRLLAALGRRAVLATVPLQELTP